MSIIVSSFLPFPRISWWAMAGKAETVLLDGKEHFEKMTDRNRYYISGANGMVQLSIPLVKGRDQRGVMEEVQISNHEDWKKQHWRTLVSVYGRSPYFEHYAPELTILFQQEHSSLATFNLATMQWVKKHLKLSFKETYSERFEKIYGAGYIDMRRQKRKKPEGTFPEYYQMFSERNGFLADLSILDLLFSEGPYAMDWIRKNETEILSG